MSDHDVPLGVVNAVLFEDLCDDGDGGVDRVGDNQNKGLRGDGGNPGCQIFDDTSIDLDGVVSNRDGLWSALHSTNLEQIIS